MRRIALTHEDMEDLMAGASINVPAEDGNEEFILLPPDRGGRRIESKVES